MSEYEGILASLEDLHKKLDRLLGWQVPLEEAPKSNPIMGDGIPEDARFPDTKREPTTQIHSPGFEDYKPAEVEEKEEVDMDFSQVTVMNQTEKGLLVVKKGFQQWLARQFIKDPLPLGYQNGNVYNIVLKEESNAGKPIGWITKKWEPFEVFKG